MALDKNQKLAIVFGPILIVVVVCFMFKDIFFNSASGSSSEVALSTESSDDFFSIDVKKDSVPADKLAMYEEKNEREQKERMIEAQAGEDFFEMDVVAKKENSKVDNDSLTKEEDEIFLKERLGMGKEEKEEKKKTPTQPVKKIVKSQDPVSTQAKIIEPPIQVETKRKRKAAPAFDDQVEASPVNTAGAFIPAVIHNEQTIKDKAPVILRITESLLLQNCTIPANSLITGIASFIGNRVGIKITSVKCNGTPMPVNLIIYDNSDGQEGISVPGLSDQQKLGGDAVADAVTESTQALRIPVIGRSLQKGGEQLSKPNSQKAVFDSGTKVLIKNNG
jgi:hypothetical protein